MSKRIDSVFVAFEGGGAKALLHVGALAALEERHVDVRGYAGTSAGSIVAALAAAGFTAKEIFDSDTRRTLIDRLGEIDPSVRSGRDLFGDGGWKRVRKLRFLIRNAQWIGPFFLLTILGTCVLLGWNIAAGNSDLAWVSGGVLFGLIAFSGYVIWRVSTGLNRVDAMRKLFGSLLQQKLFPGEEARVVLMKDMGLNDRPDLKIVSADIDRQDIRLFSAHDTPDVAVADAVAASSCLPLVFSPHIIDGHRHVDGGIVSNLPAWPFDEERELAPDALTIAMKIVGAPAEKGSWISAVIMTTLFGAGRLSLRALGRVELIKLPTKVETLDFDMSVERACKVVVDAQNAAGVALDDRLVDMPRNYRNACGLVQAIAEESIETILGITGHRVRAAVALQNADYHQSLRLRYEHGFENDRDARLLLPIDGTAAGQAWRTRQSVFATQPFAPHLQMEGDDHAARRNALWPDRKWIMAVPVDTDLGDGPLVVQIDGDADLSHDPIAAQDVLSELEDVVLTFFKDIETKRKEGG